jgi:Domain of unknown function (DUF4224)
MKEDTFLTPAELERLTGRAQKSKQAEQLRIQGIPFHLDWSGHPVVTREYLHGKKKTAAEKPQRWQPAVLSA